MESSATTILELEHATGYSGTLQNCVHIHPNGKDYISIAGGCIIISDLSDPHNQSFLRGHDDDVTCLAISNDGTMLASGQLGENADVIIWDYATKKLKCRLSEHDHAISCLDFSQDDKLLVSCGNHTDKRMFVWDTTSGYIVSSIPLAPDNTIQVRFGGFVKDVKGRNTDRYQFATIGNKQLVIWALDPRSGSVEKDIINTGSVVRDYICLKFSPTMERYLYCGTTSGDFCTFQMKNKMLIGCQSVCSRGVTSVKPVDDEQILVGGGDGKLTLFDMDVNSFEEVRSIKLNGAVKSISLSSDGVEVLAATDLGFLYRIRMNDFAAMLLSENHTSPVLTCSYPEGVSDKYGTASVDGTIRLWDASDYSVYSRCTAPGGTPLCLAFTEEIIASGWEDGRLRVYSVDGSRLLWTIDNAHRGGVTAVCLSKNLRFICTGGMEGEVRVWEMKSKEMISHLKQHTSKVTKIELFDDDVHLVTCSRDKSLLVWDLRSEKRVSAHAQRMGGINSFAILPDQNQVITVGQDRKITLWDLREANPIRIQETSPDRNTSDECFSVTLSSDGKYFATAGAGEVLRLWDFASGRLVSEGRGHSGCMTSLAFSHDNKQIVTGGRDGCVFVWNVFLP